MNDEAPDAEDMEIETAPEPTEIIEIPLYINPTTVANLPQDHTDLIARELIVEPVQEPSTLQEIVILDDDDSNHSNQNEEATTSEAKKRCYSDEASDDDGSLCPICFDNWTNTGEHRVVSLKCGHVFGSKCLNRWFTVNGAKTCPTCKKKVGRNDVRKLYVKKLVAVDAFELEDTKKQLQSALQERNHLQTELAKCTMRERLLHQEITTLKVQLNARNNAPVVNNPVRNMDNVRLYMDKSLEVCKFSGSRVFDVNPQLDLAVVSMKSPTLFNGFCVKKINVTTYKPLGFIPLHSLQIRDICFHRENNWVMSVSMDKTFKIHDNNSNLVCFQYSHEMPLWSCCWDLNNTSCLYVGTQSGTVLKYDVRQLTGPVCNLAIEGDMSPVVSVASIPSGAGRVLPLGGVVSCKLNSLWLYENKADNEPVRYPLTLEGPFISMKYQTSTEQLLVSSRPNSRVKYSRHTLCTLGKQEDDRIDCNVIHEFQGGGMQKLLSKSCFVCHQSDYVAAHQENTKSVFLWSINTGQKVCSVPAHDAALDLKGLQTGNGHFLVSLTEKKLEFFKFVS